MGPVAFVRAQIAELKREIAANNGAPAFEWRTNFVFIATAVLLVLFYYYGRPTLYRDTVFAERWPAFLVEHGWSELTEVLPYAYWGLSSLLFRVVVPLALIVLVLRESPRDYGYRLEGQLRHAPVYLGFYVAMLPLLFWAATQESFQDKYPFYERAHEGGAQFWTFEFFYALQFIGVEAFFRGFLLFGLYKKFGYYALPIMAIPYAMIHFNKPLPETLGAIAAAFILGYLAIRSRSFVLGICLHLGVAVTMDVLAVAKTYGGLGPTIEALFP